MSHEVEKMLFVGRTPWHRLGTKLDAPPTAAEAIKLAGLDWNVAKVPLFLADGTPVKAWATMRDTDGRVLGDSVGERYVPLQNRDMFNFLDPFLASGEATIETAGSLRHGARVWVLAKLNRAPMAVVKGDEVEKYILVSNGHDGLLSIRTGFTMVRVVCANTMGFAHCSAESQLIRVRHTAGAADTLEKIGEIMNAANAAFEATGEQFRYLASRRVNGDDLKKFVRLVVAPKRVQPTPAAAAPVVPGRSMEELLAMVDDGAAPAPEVEESENSRTIDRILELVEGGKGNTLPGVKGTAWAALNGVTEYVTHHARGTAESRLDSCAHGAHAGLIDRALEVATEMAEGKGRFA